MMKGGREAYGKGEKIKNEGKDHWKGELWKGVSTLTH